MSQIAALGGRVRALRQRGRITQAQLALQLGISPSYLNLIEQNRRPLPAMLLIKLSDILQIDLKTFSTDADIRRTGELIEVFADPLFDEDDVTTQEVRDLVATSPVLSRAIVRLFDAYRSAARSRDSLAARLSDGQDLASEETLRLPTEEVSDLIQHHANFFPVLEEGSARVSRDGRLDTGDMAEQLTRYLESHCGVRVKLDQADAMGGATRRYDPARRELTLSEVLRRGSRNFQLAYQIGLLTQSDAIDGIAADPLLTSDESRALCRVALANYFAAAVLMPYDAFLAAAQAERYDLELLGHRFRVKFEQTCHRLTTLRKPGHEGVPFHMVRVDIAGNISKRFSASGLRFARYSGACPRWVVFAAFLTPGEIRTQLSEMPDGTRHFWVARTVRKARGGYHAPRTEFALGLGCEVRHAARMIYAEGMNLHTREAIVPVGVTCRACERMDCEQRAFPALQHRLKINEHVRGLSFYVPVDRC
ncbi:MAG: XRE family transcriptional regulator [Acidobacteria bacterium]|nr:MAG: XRE family transcriptional regulator [Acidobacteriota bacterium]